MTRFAIQTFGRFELTLVKESLLIMCLLRDCLHFSLSLNVFHILLLLLLVPLFLSPVSKIIFCCLTLSTLGINYHINNYIEGCIYLVSLYRVIWGHFQRRI